MNRKMMSIAAVAVLSATTGSVRISAANRDQSTTETIVGNIDATSLPAAYRPKKEKGKKTFVEYGYTAETRADGSIVLRATAGAQGLSVRILDDSGTEAYACISEPESTSGEPKTQSVIHLKRKVGGGLWKARESFREFASCPAIGEGEPEASPYGG
jgi:hypothetical protein